MDAITLSILTSVLGLSLGASSVLIINRIKNKRTSDMALNLVEKARKEAEKIKRESLFEVKEETHKLKLEVEKDVKEKKNEVKELEDRLLQREGSMDKRDEMLQNREKMLDQRDNNLVLKQKEIQMTENEMEEIKKQQLDLLEKISSFSREKAHDLIMKKVEETMEKEIAEYIRERELEAKLQADRDAKSLLVESMQKYASDVASEQTISVITLPNDDMKGRIIGREGRNIRTIEAVTGVDLIIDDTPEAIVISSFDPFRREIAKITIESLIKDGRIHPARIEELYDKTSKEMNAKILEYGRDATFELGLTKIEPQIVELLGKLHFRTSYGQNALQHSKEVAYLVGIMASEIGENVTLAKRAGLLHDIGKAIDFEIEGSHIEVGIDIAKKNHEDPIVINSIASHHGDTAVTSNIAGLVAIADAVSASRPGARNDSLENYTKRLEQLETIASDVRGVDKVFAIQAGRELRILVNPEEIDDLKSIKTARDIKERIEKEVQYPGTVKITVIRETRAIEEAK
ncbi:MAG: ribonuclease Y [Bacilli bacterium]|nr:ribonuclease Y [Bacilli bacterium]MDD3305083.1 ribonuclease Y [Bacilli bacterium]MDD4053447.1 ribonuclease Y [Bacilli bacterium]MDD4410906.1 ribonuclease Y [Bacilli bacterium]